MLIGVVLTCTAHGRPIWRVYDVNRESPEDVLVDRNFANPPPWRVIGPYEVSFSEEDKVNPGRDPGVRQQVGQPGAYPGE